jgi:hypothetical protein
MGAQLKFSSVTGVKSGQNDQKKTKAEYVRAPTLTVEPHRPRLHRALARHLGLRSRQ